MNKKLLHTLLSIFLTFFISSSFALPPPVHAPVPAPALAPVPAPALAPAAASVVSAAVITDLTDKINQLTAQVNLLMQKTQYNVNQIRTYSACVNRAAQYLAQITTEPTALLVRHGGERLLSCQEILSNLQP